MIVSYLTGKPLTVRRAIASGRGIVNRSQECRLARYNRAAP